MLKSAEEMIAYFADLAIIIDTLTSNRQKLRMLLNECQI